MCVSRKPGVGCTFPARDVTILSLCLTLNIYTLVNLFPYVGVMVKDLLELETTNELGYHAGYVASAFMFGRFVSGYPLGYLADFIGRKPVIIGGLISIMLCSLAFGLSPTFGFALTSRFVLGLTNGIAPALRTTMRDLCGLEHVMKGMTYLGGGKAASLVLGTAVGGLLAQPALNYPSLFSENGIFGRYPFLLPNLLGSIAAAVLLPVVVLFIPETKHFEERRSGTDGTRKGAADEKPPKEASHTGAASGLTKAKGRGSLAYLQMTDRNDGDSLGPELQEVASSKRGTTTESAAGDDDGHGHVVPVDKAERGLWGPDGVLAVPHVKMVLFLVFLVQALVVGFEEAYPLWALSTPDRGGLGWDTIDIGKVLLSAGVLVAVVHIGILPGRAKSLGITTLQRMGCLVAILTFVFVPLIKVFSWNDSSLHVVSAISIFFIYCGMGVVILALTIASTTMVPSDMCGTLSGLFNSTESLGRFVGPVAFATMFAWSISTSSPDWVNHYFVFFGSAFSMVFVSVLAWATITDENITHKELNSRSDDTVADRCGSSEQEAIGGPDPIACSTTKIDLV